MLALTAIWRWTPKYFHKTHRPRRTPQRLVPQNTAPKRPTSLKLVAKMAPPRMAAAPSPPLDGRDAALMQHAGLLYATIQSCTHQNLPQDSPPLLRAQFCARADVLSPLSHRLPPPLPHLRGPTRTSSSSSSSSLRVIPEDELDDPAAFCARNQQHAHFHLAQLVLLLQLYAAVGHDDGALLLSLMSEVHQRVVEMQKHGAASQEDYACLPDLLWSLSEVGITVESTLQVIVAPPSSSSASSAPKTHSTAETPRVGVLYAALRHYREEELLKIIVALHRFRLWQHHAMKQVVRAMRERMWSKETSSHQLRRGMGVLVRRGVVRQTSPHTPEEIHAILMPVVQNIHGDLDMPMPLLVEAMTALALSAHRREDIVDLVAAIILVNALALLPITPRSEAYAQDSSLVSQQKAALEALPHQLVQITQVCEQMELPQPLLADALRWACDASSRGVLVDGGEDADISSDRLAPYDHVTADLVKLQSVR